MRGIGDENFFGVEGPLDLKKIFVSDFNETQNLKSLWPKDLPREIWEESETKIFFGVEGSPLWTSKNFSSRILMKLKIWYPRKIEIGKLKLENWNWKIESGKLKLEIGKLKLENWKLKLENWNWKIFLVKNPIHAYSNIQSCYTDIFHC